MKYKLILTFVSFALLHAASLANTENLLQNGDFEIRNDHNLFPAKWQIAYDDPSGTSKVLLDSEDKYDGNFSLKINQSNAEAFSSVLQTIEVKSDQNYEIHCFAKVTDLDGEGAGARLFVTDGDSQEELAHCDIKSSDWTPVSATFNSGKNTSIIIRCYLHKTAGTAWFDNVQLKEVN